MNKPRANKRQFMVLSVAKVVTITECVRSNKIQFIKGRIQNLDMCPFVLFRLLFSYIVKCEDIQYNKKYREIRLILTFTLQDFVRMQITVMSKVLYIHFVRERI